MRSEADVREFLRLVNVQLSGPLEVMGDNEEAVRESLIGQRAAIEFVLGERGPPPAFADVEEFEEIVRSILAEEESR